MAVKQDIQVGLIAVVGTISAMLLLISIWGVEGWYAYEMGVLDEQRFEEGRNLEWMTLRDEQYRNLGDTVGNGTIYAGTGMTELPGGGYRYISESRDAAAIPIHEAMARLVRESGGGDVTGDQMRQIDREPIRTANEAFQAYMVPTAFVPEPRRLGQESTTRPAGAPSTGPAAAH